MDNEKVSLNLGGRQVAATPIEVNQCSEKWNEYFLEDGSVVKMKLVVKKIFRVDGEYDPDGNPVYFVQSTNVTTVSSPKHLRKEPQ